MATSATDSDDYTTMRLRRDAVAKLQRLARLVAADLDRPTGPSDVLNAAMDWALEHTDLVSARLRKAAAS
jgi:hypothetical protein